MSGELFVLSALDWFGRVCLLASLLVLVLPTPREINRRWYGLIYGILRRAAVNWRLGKARREWRS